MTPGERMPLLELKSLVLRYGALGSAGRCWARRPPAPSAAGRGAGCARLRPRGPPLRAPTQEAASRGQRGLTVLQISSLQVA